MSKNPIELPPLEYLPQAVKPIANQAETSRNKSGGYAPATSDFYSEVTQKNERSLEKFKKAAKSNPLVPMGCLITVGVLFNGIMAMRNNDRVKSQRMMRYRVLAQGATVFALVVGTFWSQFMYHPKE